MVDHARALQVTSAPLSELLSSIGVYLSGRGLDMRLARELHERSLEMQQRLYEGDHPDVAAATTDLAIALRWLGGYGRARELDEQALAMRQRIAER